VLSPDDLRQAIAAGNLGALTRVPGIGPKVAQRLVLELKDKVGQLAVIAGQPAVAPTGWRDQVASGLEGLGWSRRDAEAACDRVADLAEAVPAPPVAVLMRAALRSLAK
jgi:Holliday junction DNA helicase RuvA